MRVDSVSKARELPPRTKYTLCGRFGTHAAFLTPAALPCMYSAPRSVMKLFSAKLQTTMRYENMLCCPASVPLPADVASHTQAHQHQVETYKALVHLSHTNLATIHEIDGRFDVAVDHLVKVQGSLLLLTVAACRVPHSSHTPICTGIGG